ncbi:CHORDC1 [Acanthosepion pharaonis]|uniref:CHORDC1 n=1 Tax=Acanthosepion pharaonis TaxID=158019 RepID=A0A812BKY1_ACAPH|nr:CHORDC1 [Sepia pharaonis]
MLTCYNRSCGKEFDPSSNEDDSCTFHPGVPVFHDTIKKWSCCNKSSVDFTVFLDIPGCTKGRHNPTPPTKEVSKSVEKEPLTVRLPKPKDPPPRPSEDEPITKLKMTVLDNLKEKLNNLMADLKINDKRGDSNDITIGTPCQNSSCKQSYEGEHSNSQICVYHSGQAVFHEGLKYWSCCERKTTDFSSFLDQPGCETGKHVWKKQVATTASQCRYDWHQTGTMVTVTIYAKMMLPEESFIETNQVICNIFIKYDGGKKAFSKKIVLGGVIDCSQSEVRITCNKVEINLRKADSSAWTALEY